MTFQNGIAQLYAEYVDALVRSDADALSELWGYGRTGALAERQLR